MTGPGVAFCRPPSTDRAVRCVEDDLALLRRSKRDEFHALRVAARLSLAGAADVLERPRGTIYAWETDRDPPAWALEKLRRYGARTGTDD